MLPNPVINSNRFLLHRQHLNSNINVSLRNFIKYVLNISNRINNFKKRNEQNIVLAVTYFIKN